jgi:AraC family transcriptional regulator of adaptative response / DNA-3-methyladenine glycosylase II
LIAYAERWRPWRAYAVQHLWGATRHPINQWPPLAPARATDAERLAAAA